MRVCVCVCVRVCVCICVLHLMRRFEQQQQQQQQQQQRTVLLRISLCRAMVCLGALMWNAAVQRRAVLCVTRKHAGRAWERSGKGKRRVQRRRTWAAGVCVCRMHLTTSTARHIMARHIGMCGSTACCWGGWGVCRKKALQSPGSPLQPRGS